jgi:hypothetical protein
VEQACVFGEKARNSFHIAGLGGGVNLLHPRSAFHERFFRRGPVVP